MDTCCTSMHIPRPQRRINGLQLPLNYQQVIGWVVFTITASINFIIIVEIQFHELKIVSIITFVILYVCHASSHVTAALIDPSERELRKLKVNNVPEFDRSIHAHVIENGRCHLCNIYTSSKSTKHCSLCNKCVDQFDHHCKWLNNCVGQRNYAAFITCVTTALLISLYTTSLCVTDIVLFLANPQRLGIQAQIFINCTAESPTHIVYCRNSISFLTFLIIFGASALAIACALLHLCCFHIYISFLGVSTYEYIVKSGGTKTSKSTSHNHNTSNCCAINMCRNIHIISKHSEKKDKTYKPEGTEGTIENKPANDVNIATNHSQNREDSKVTSLISVLIANEIDKAKKIFLYDKNKIHPQSEISHS